MFHNTWGVGRAARAAYIYAGAYYEGLSAPTLRVYAASMSECKTTILVTRTHTYIALAPAACRPPYRHTHTQTKTHPHMCAHTDALCTAQCAQTRARSARLYGAQYFIYFPVKFCALISHVFGASCTNNTCVRAREPTATRTTYTSYTRNTHT